MRYCGTACSSSVVTYGMAGMFFTSKFVVDRFLEAEGGAAAVPAAEFGGAEKETTEGFAEERFDFLGVGAVDKFGRMGFV